MQHNTIFSQRAHGKFLITGEYLVLEGAQALAIPLRYGQNLTVKTNEALSGKIVWKAQAGKETWLDATLQVEHLTVALTNNDEAATRLADVLQAARALNPDFLNDVKGGFEITTQVDFDRAWGLGTSSTLIALVAAWAQVNPYALLARTFGGSGYDIACATASGPLVYALKNGQPNVQSVQWEPEFMEELFFVYSGQKMDSRAGMHHFKTHGQFTASTIDKINVLTKAFTHVQDRQSFEYLMEEHEYILSQVLRMQPVKDAYFSDYPGAIKSLGAWGGDFLLVTGTHTREVVSYFKSKGLNTIIPFGNMIL